MHVHRTVEAQSFSRMGEFIDSPLYCLAVHVRVTVESIFGPLLMISAWERFPPNGFICAALKALLPDILKITWGIIMCDSH